MTVGQFMKWCGNKSTPPKKRNDPYVLAYDGRISDDGDEERFDYLRALITKRRMLRSIRKTDRLHVDGHGTYKLNWEGLPTVVIGTTDHTRKFQTIAIAVVYSETQLDY